MPDFNELQNQMLRSAKFDLSQIQALQLCALGIGGEAGEISDLVKKVAFHDHPVQPEKFVEEGGDLLWYVAYFCKVVDLNFEEVMTEVKISDEVVYAHQLDNRLPNTIKAALKLTNFAGDFASWVDWIVFNHPEEILPIIKFESYKHIYKSKLTHLVAWLREIALFIICDLEGMCEFNIEKLLKRYPDGFSSEASLARVDAK